MINNETIIYELCNKYQWFTCGSVRQYEKSTDNGKGWCSHHGAGPRHLDLQ